MKHNIPTQIGDYYPLKEAGHKLGLNYQQAHYRYKTGWFKHAKKHKNQVFVHKSDIDKFFKPIWE